MLRAFSWLEVRVSFFGGSAFSFGACFAVSRGAAAFAALCFSHFATLGAFGLCLLLLGVRTPQNKELADHLNASGVELIGDFVVDRFAFFAFITRNADFD